MTPLLVPSNQSPDENVDNPQRLVYGQQGYTRGMEKAAIQDFIRRRAQITDEIIMAGIDRCQREDKPLPEGLPWLYGAF